MESVGIICGIILGLFGSVFSVVQFIYQRHKDKEQAEREVQRDKVQAERDKAQAGKDEKQDLKDRLYFLAQLIVDRDIPRESRQIFFDEYIAKGGNGSFVRWWLEGK
ncbi:hypothetical protein FACS1894161_2330 [Spirochaetia bacterium]|nr:hypothetical protein FACS1894161_2330 [Spirochaetia bacterium]